MKEFHIAWEQFSHGKRVVGVFEDKAMAKTWGKSNPQHSIESVPRLGKTFAEMSIEYNRKYEVM